MSDCCWMELTCRREHKSVFEAMGFRIEEERDDGSVRMIDEQANYAHDGDLRALAGKGIPFHAENGPGGEYGDGRYACDGQRVAQVDCLQGGGPVVEVGEDGVPDADQLHKVHDYYAVLTAAKRATGEGLPPGFRWKSADEILCKRLNVAQTVGNATRGLLSMVVLNDGETWTSIDNVELVILPADPSEDVLCMYDNGEDAVHIVSEVAFTPPSGVFDLDRLVRDLPMDVLERYRLRAGKGGGG